jgi:hypothetical protein
MQPIDKLTRSDFFPDVIGVKEQIRLRPEHCNHVWSYDFVEDRTHDGRKYRMLNVLEEELLVSIFL